VVRSSKTARPSARTDPDSSLLPFGNRESQHADHANTFMGPSPRSGDDRASRMMRAGGGIQRLDRTAPYRICPFGPAIGGAIRSCPPNSGQDEAEGSVTVIQKINAICIMSPVIN
jgi:hypothetical protein